MPFKSSKNCLTYSYDSETLIIEPWGNNAFRVRATKLFAFPDEDWALLKSEAPTSAQVTSKDATETITNGNISATVTATGKLTIHNTSTWQPILEEFVRNRKNVLDSSTSALEIEARDFKPIIGADAFHLTARFESLDEDEKIFGMGQYQQSCMNLKGADLELAQRNSQASVPFAVSSLGYGFLWNCPSIGRAVFGKNQTTFEAYSTPVLDYWIVTGSTPAEILEAYAKATGTVPMMPEYGLGFWQCKLRYQTQEELLQVAREYRRRELPIDLIVVDFFHWPKQGEWKFDPTYWPDPSAMVKELKDLKIELMVSIWPTVDKLSTNYQEMLTDGLLVRVERGHRTTMDFQGDCVFFDATNPASRDFVWKTAKRNYFDLGIKTFWLDEAEPEYSRYDFEMYRYHRGSNLAVGNIYPHDYARAFYEGQEAAGQKNIVNLLRCAWAGSQKYGALCWSGDIASSWQSFRIQLLAGLNMGLSGIPWWTTDIGGFHGGDPNDPKFRELFVRWFQFGAYCPVMRLHGDREPKQPQHGTTGGAGCRSGAPNEVWSYGEDVYKICKKYMRRREEMREYTRSLMKEAHEKGTPVMRTCFYEFPKDEKTWTLKDQYMYGGLYLCAPVQEAGARRRQVYFPAGARWRDVETGEEYAGGETKMVEAPIERMPVFARL